MFESNKNPPVVTNYSVLSKIKKHGGKQITVDFRHPALLGHYKQLQPENRASTAMSIGSSLNTKQMISRQNVNARNSMN